MDKKPPAPRKRNAKKGVSKSTQATPEAQKSAPENATAPQFSAPMTVPVTALPSEPRSLLKRIVDVALFGKVYIIASLVILFATTIFWASLSAKVQQTNADQLVNFYLLDHLRNFHTATMPGQHTFLIKWPIYLLVGWAGVSVTSINYATIGIALLTVMAFAIILYSIERRPLVFGTICLALASTLMLVPAEPYPGGVLPVNMSMLATRNIEYVGYILVLWFFIKAQRVRSWLYLVGVLLLTVLIASDKIFLVLSLGGSAVSIVLYTFSRRWTLVSLSALWVAGSAIAGVLSGILLDVLNSSHLINIANSASVNPYNFITSLHSLELGLIYAVFAFLTVFGANPAGDTRLLHHVPSEALHTLAGVSGLTLIINCLVLVGGIAAALILVHQTAFKGRHDPTDNKASLSTMLLWSTVVALCLFVGTNHYYPVDARYVGIATFSLFVIGTTYIRKFSFKSEHALLVGLILVAGIVAGVPLVSKSYHDESSALDLTESRNQTVAEVLQHHRVDTLLGDYWRVMPIILDSGNKLNVTPLSNCTQPQSIQTSSTWQLDLNKNSFAYLLTMDKSPTNSPSCSIKQIIAAYGKPNDSFVIAGTALQPKELLLFYDNGIHKSAPVAAPTKLTTVVPISLSDLPYTSCAGPTVMNVVAHEDDDILFINPDTYNSIKAGYCVRSVYITAGDAGSDQYYWLDRERGAEAAYSYMLGSNAIWVNRIVELSNHEIVSVANPRGNSKISLVFFHLPDGNLKGQGFPATHFQSVAELYSGKLPYITSVDGQSKYSAPDLTNALEAFMRAYQPTMIRTQATYDDSKTVAEHSDHMAVGLFTEKAYTQYENDAFANQVKIPIKFYIGYPVRTMPQNVFGTDLTDITNIFLAYAHNDPAVCQSGTQCLLQKNNYTSYLSREYSYSPTD